MSVFATTGGIQGGHNGNMMSQGGFLRWGYAQGEMLNLWFGTTLTDTHTGQQFDPVYP